MAFLEQYIDDLQSHGRYFFTKEEGLLASHKVEDTFLAAAKRLKQKKRLFCPKQGFYLILRPEDRIAGIPDPTRWIDPFMNYQNIDYRVSLLYSATLYGSSHQASMIFQVITPKQLRSIEFGRYRIQFIYQAPKMFEKVNESNYLTKTKTDTGYYQMAGIELTLFDVTKYFKKSAGLNGVAQIVHDIGKLARLTILKKIAPHYENTVVRRLGYLFECFGYTRQAETLFPFAKKAKSFKPLDPSHQHLTNELAEPVQQNTKWMLTINNKLEIDS